MEPLLKSSLLLYCGIFASIISFSSAQSLFDTLMNDGDPCEEVCRNTYPSHTYEEGLSGQCCSRGCRLYSIIELVGDINDSNKTLHACFENCHDAYPDQEEYSSSCILGCNSQKPFANKLGKMSDFSLRGPEGDLADLLYPVLYMHNLYSNMVDKVTHHMSVSWSFFMQDGKGHFVVMKTEPQILDASDVDDFDDYSVFRGTSSNVETNIGPWDNTATEMLRHSQLKSARAIRDDIPGELNAAETYWANGAPEDTANSDWLSCISRKTGIPRLLLCVILLLSAVAMIWLCMSAAVTAPEHRLSQQKLSIQGDLEYLRKFAEKDGIKRVHPQDFVEARPLPVKIRVEQI